MPKLIVMDGRESLERKRPDRADGKEKSLAGYMIMAPCWFAKIKKDKVVTDSFCPNQEIYICGEDGLHYFRYIGTNLSTEPRNILDGSVKA